MHSSHSGGGGHGGGHGGGGFHHGGHGGHGGFHHSIGGRRRRTLLSDGGYGGGPYYWWPYYDYIGCEYINSIPVCFGADKLPYIIDDPTTHPACTYISAMVCFNDETGAPYIINYGV